MSNGHSGFRLGVVSYLNAKPLIAGLDADPAVQLIFDVPARLPDLLDAGGCDCALVPIVDLVARGRNWRIVSDSCIGCDGETFTVRVFSRVPPEQMSTLHVDGDSHTSIVLARIIWQELFGRSLTITPFRGNESLDECEGVLLIGDKVVNQNLIEHDIQTDLGAAWKTLTSLPFVFAVWAAPPHVSLGDLPARLSRARDRGVETAALIAEDFGPGLGWPVALARRYLTGRLKFHLGEPQREGMRRFFELARKHELLAVERQPVFA
jgi:chorismate dehydratase